MTDREIIARLLARLSKSESLIKDMSSRIGMLEDVVYGAEAASAEDDSVIALPQSKKTKYSLSEAARVFGVHRATIHRAIKNGKIAKHETPTGRVFVSHSSMTECFGDPV